VAQIDADSQNTNRKRKPMIACKLLVLIFLLSTFTAQAEDALVNYVDPFLGTAPLTDVADIGFEPPWRVWAGLTFPGASLPNAMVQLSPITEFGSGAGYEYEDHEIHAFTHTNKGHWNLCYIPILPVSGPVDPRDFGSTFSHEKESAHPGYYQVFLERYGVDAELTTTPRCGFHRYTYQDGHDKRLVVNLAVSNERVRDWQLEQAGDHGFQGYQHAHEKVYFYAETNHKIAQIETLAGRRRRLSVVHFADRAKPLEIKIGLSFVSTENAKLNLEQELTGKSFEQTKDAATQIWETLLAKIKVAGGTERQRGLFYSCLYRSFLWPALRSDVNGEFTDEAGHVVKKDFSYYTIPSLWDDYRNKLVLLGMLSPQVTEDVAQSMVDRGEVTGFMPTFFHGDHAAAFISGTYLRGLRGFDVRRAYELLLKNATVENGRARPHLQEYIEKGYISTPVVEHPTVETKAKAGVTKTLEYAYDDYALALMARELNDDKMYRMMRDRSKNYANVFDPSTGLMRGRLKDGNWVEPFDSQFPYYEYMYREANAWQSSFFAPHDTEGLIALYPNKAAFEQQLDRLFSIPWNPKHIAMNVNSFIGQYCHGNQPDHGFPYLYYWVNKQEKSQEILNVIMDRFYGMSYGRTLCGMDDAGEMSAWYVFNAIGLYPYSPADDEYIVTVPLFDRVELNLNGKTIPIIREGAGPKIVEIDRGDKKINGYFITHKELIEGQPLTIKTSPPTNDKYSN
jgi:predicted alpha-1,2-mannosidase